MGERERGPEPADSADPADPLDTPPAPTADPAAAPGLALTALSDSPLRLAQRRDRQAADLRQKLDEKAAATDELREALHELRQVLDVDNPPPHENPRHRGARLAALALVLVLAAALLMWLLFDHDPGRIVAGTPSPTPSPAAAAPTPSPAAAAPTPSPAAAAPTPSPAAAAPTSGTPAAGAPASGGRTSSSALAVSPLPWPGGAVLTPPGLTTTGPGATVPGTDVQVAVDADGRHLDVFERLLLGTPSTEPLTLAAPTLPSLTSKVRVRDLQVQLDQVQLDDQAVPVTTAGSSSWRAASPADDSYTRVTLRYRLPGGVTRVTPAPPGRALGIVTPLTGRISRQHAQPFQVRTVAQGVVGVSCPTAMRGAVCGTRTAAGWVAAVPPGATPTVVLLQLDTRR